MNSATRMARRTAVLLLVVLLASRCGARGRDDLRLALSYPPRGIETSFQQIRIAGSCHPSCGVRVNGKPVRVYPTGAFVDLVGLEEGENVIEVIAECRGQREKAELVVTCTDPLVTSPVSSLIIDRAMMEPRVDTVLQPGDDLRVQVKGSPGARAYWSLGHLVNDAVLEEQEPARNGPLKGIAGVYRGAYRTKEGDHAASANVRFRLVSGDGEEVEASSRGRVTLLPEASVERGIVGDRGARLSEEPGGEMVWELSPGTRVNMCGSFGEYCRLVLSGSERYWAERKSVRAVKGKGRWEPSSAGKPVVSREAGGAKLFLPLDGRPPVRARQDAGRGSITVELFGTKGPETRLKVRDAPPIKQVKVGSGKEGRLRVDVYLKGGQQWGYRCRFTDEGLTLKIRESPGKGLDGMTIVIDPGHGGAQPGAVSITGVPEKEFNLEIARALAGFLGERGARTVLTREKDAALSLAERIEIARRENADIFVSVHNNSRSGHADPLSRRGADLFYDVPQSRKLAERILNRLKKIGLEANGCHSRNFAVTLPTDYPAVLVECAYLSHPEDEEMVLKNDFPGEIGRAIGKGVVDFVRKAR